MLDQDMIVQIGEYMKKLDKPVVFRMNQEPNEKKSELVEMLEEIASTSTKLHLDMGNYSYRSGVTFEVIPE